MNTFMINKHDTMLLNLDASGQNAIFYRRRERCFLSFTAPQGMPKDLGLFYCFLLFEGKDDLMYLTRRLSDDVSYSAGALDSVSSLASTSGSLLQTPSQYNMSKHKNTVSSASDSANKKSKLHSGSGDRAAAVMDLTGRYQAFKESVMSEGRLCECVV
jgi:hypothetical protein